MFDREKERFPFDLRQCGCVEGAPYGMKWGAENRGRGSQDHCLSCQNGSRVRKEEVCG